MKKQAWFAIRVPYSREMKLKIRFDEKGIATFLPMHYTKNGKGKKILVPAIHNLLFINAAKEQIDQMRDELYYKLPFFYIIDRTKRQPIVVPERQMQSFIAVAGTLDERLLYLNDIDSKLGKGDKVRVTGGVFEGVEGEIMRIRRDRRVVVSVKGLVAVATAYIHPTLLIKVDD